MVETSNFPGKWIVSRGSQFLGRFDTREEAMNADTKIRNRYQVITVANGAKDTYAVFDNYEAAVVADGFRTRREAEAFIADEL